MDVTDLWVDHRACLRDGELPVPVRYDIRASRIFSDLVERQRSCIDYRGQVASDCWPKVNKY